MDANSIKEKLLADNAQFINRQPEFFFQSHQDKQSPLFTLLTCSDSRVQAEVAFAQSINHVFTIRNIGNQVITSEGSLDYGILHLKTPCLLILGHANCGAVQACLKGYGNETTGIKKELSCLEKAIGHLESKNIAAHELTIKNIHRQVDIASRKYLSLVQDNKLQIIGAFYDFANLFHQGDGKLVIINVNNIPQEP